MRNTTIFFSLPIIIFSYFFFITPSPEQRIPTRMPQNLLLGGSLVVGGNSTFNGKINIIDGIVISGGDLRVAQGDILIDNGNLTVEGGITVQGTVAGSNIVVGPNAIKAFHEGDPSNNIEGLVYINCVGDGKTSIGNNTDGGDVTISASTSSDNPKTITLEGGAIVIKGNAVTLGNPTTPSTVTIGGAQDTVILGGSSLTIQTPGITALIFNEGDDPVKVLTVDNTGLVSAESINLIDDPLVLSQGITVTPGTTSSINGTSVAINTQGSGTTVIGSENGDTISLSGSQISFSGTTISFSGPVTLRDTLTVNGMITGNGGMTITEGPITLSSGSNPIAIGTTGTGAITIGNNGENGRNVTINSSLSNGTITLSGNTLSFNFSAFSLDPNKTNYLTINQQGMIGVTSTAPQKKPSPKRDSNDGGTFDSLLVTDSTTLQGTVAINDTGNGNTMITGESITIGNSALNGISITTSNSSNLTFAGKDIEVSGVENLVPVQGKINYLVLNPLTKVIELYAAPGKITPKTRGGDSSLPTATFDSLLVTNNATLQGSISINAAASGAGDTTICGANALLIGGDQSGPITINSGNSPLAIGNGDESTGSIYIGNPLSTKSITIGGNELYLTAATANAPQPTGINYLTIDSNGKLNIQNVSEEQNTFKEGHRGFIVPLPLQLLQHIEQFPLIKKAIVFDAQGEIMTIDYQKLIQAVLYYFDQQLVVLEKINNDYQQCVTEKEVLTSCYNALETQYKTLLLAQEQIKKTISSSY